MAHSKKVIELAKNLFVIEDKDPVEIIKIVLKETGSVISEAAIYRWRKKYHWDKYIQQGGNIGLAMALQKQYFDELKKAIDEKKITDPQTADSLVKIARTLENLMPKKTLLANIFIFLEETVNFFTSKIEDDEFVKKYQKYLPELSDYLRKKYTK